MLTARAGSSIGVMNNHHALLLDDPQFLTWRLAAAGYQVASFGKQHYGCSRRAFDLEGGVVLGDRVGYTAYEVPVAPSKAGMVRYDGGRTPWLFAGRFPGEIDDTPEMHNIEAALDWLRRRDPSRPYLLRVSLNAPHTPVVTPAPFDTLIDPDDIDLPLEEPGDVEFVSAVHREYLHDYAGAHRLTSEQIRRARQCYYGHVAFLDHVLGRFLDTLREAGELENTIIAYVSDHGCHLGDHGFFQKQSFWEAAVRVPSLIAGPSIEPGIVSAPVNTGSLLPTLMELAGLDVPAFAQYPSLAPALREDMSVAAEPIFSEIDYGLWGYRSGERCVMVRDGDWKLVLFRAPQQLERLVGAEDRVLFNLATDPGETTNLATDAAFDDAVKALIAKIDAWDASRCIVPARARAGWRAPERH
jgi:arylsulfatase A-like enzyme